MTMIQKPQEPELDAEVSCNMFRPTGTKPFMATPGALAEFGQDVVVNCLFVLQKLAVKHNGLDYLQVFHLEDDEDKRLWFIEDGEGGAITALLPSEY